MASYALDEETSSRGGSPVPADLFSDSDDDGGRGRISEAEEDNSLNRREGGAAAGTQDRNTDDEEEERRKEQRKKKEKDEKKKPKGPVRRQMISEDMLIGRNGISKIPDLFKDFKFGGKGHERKDLDNVLSKLEHWIHLLHPKQPFDQSLQRIEFLGGKRKVVKTHLKKIRMGMLNNYEENDLVVEEEEDMMPNFDDTELAESASTFVNNHIEESFRNDDGEIPSASLSATINQENPGSNRNNNEFPEDDDEIFDIIDETTLVNPKAGEEMDIDMDDVPLVDDDDDDFIQKQIEAQLKRAEKADTQQNQPSQLLGEIRHDVQHTSDKHLELDEALSNQSSADLVDLIISEDISATPIDAENSGNETNGDGQVANISEPLSGSNVKVPNSDLDSVNADGKTGNDNDDGINLDDLEDNEDQ